MPEKCRADVCFPLSGLCVPSRPRSISSCRDSLCRPGFFSFSFLFFFFALAFTGIREVCSSKSSSQFSPDVAEATVLSNLVFIATGRELNARLFPFPAFKTFLRFFLYRRVDLDTLDSLANFHFHLTFH